MKQLKYLIIILLAIACTACGVKQRIRKADQKFAIGEYYDAADIYRSTYKQVKDKPTRAYLAFQQGECYHRINNQKATQAYKIAIQNRYQDSIVYLRYAQQLQYEGKYKDAEKQYNIYLEAHPDNYVAAGGAYACRQMAEWDQQFSRYIVQPAKEFNAKRSHNFAPCFTTDDGDVLYFTSNRTSGDKKLQKNSSITGYPVNNLYSTRKNAAGQWEEIALIQGLTPASSTTEEGKGSEDDGVSAGSKKDQTVPDIGVCCFSSDGKDMYFTYSKPINGLDQGAKIYKSSRASGEWAEPQEVKLFLDSTISCGHPSLSASNDTLYFSSDAPDGYGGKDLYFAELVNGQWLGVTNLGPVINTAGDEMFPCVRSNGSIYFSSNGHPGYGGLDLYQAIPNDSSYTLINLGKPFNSAGDDFGITFMGETEQGFFSSNRGKKNNSGALKHGFDQIYSFYLPEMVVEVTGNILDNAGEAISDATLRLVGNDGTNAKIQCKRDGTYRFKLTVGTKYAMLCSARGFLNQSQTLTTEGVNDSKTYTQDFILSLISKPVTMDNIFYEFGKWDLTPESETGLQQLIKLLNDNPHITIELSAHTDRVGNAEFNRNLSEKRAQSVVNYLITNGIDAARLTPVGYGMEKPVIVDKALHQKYKFLPIDQELTPEFISTLKEDQQEIADQINRRTEFRVLKTTYNLY